MHRDHAGRLGASLPSAGRPGVRPARWLAAAGAVIAALGLVFAVPVHAAAVLGGTWGTAIQIPGTARLNAGGFAEVRSVSCASRGNCGAAGYYTDASLAQRAFVVTQRNGIWGQAEQVPGMAALHATEAVAVSVSCASAGNCSAGGYDSGGAFVVTERNGIWGTAQQVPGMAGISSVSCASAGNCSAGGGDHGQAIVVTQRDGIWGTAQEVPGIARLNLGGGAGVSSVSCASRGNCSAGGYYTDANGNNQAFVVTRTDGIWGAAIEVPGTARLNKGGYGNVTAVSCASAGNCGAGGFYFDDGYNGHAFVITQRNGIWGTAIQVPGTGHFDSYTTDILSLSCPTAGNCSTGGTYLDAGHDNRAWVVAQRNGIWGTAEDVPGTGPGAGTWSVSCGSPGNCSAGGDRSGHGEAFVVNEVNGVWGTAEQVPGTAGVKPAVVASVSCTAANRCSAGGSYYDSAHHFQVFVVTRR